MSKGTISSRVGGVTISAPPSKGITIGQKAPTMVLPFAFSAPGAIIENFRERVSMLKNKEGGALLTPDEITKLDSIFLTNNEPFFRISGETDPIIYEIISQIYTRGFTNVYDELTSKKWNDRSEYYFSASPELELSRQKASIDKEIFTNKIEASKGAFKCRKCGSEETVSVEKQMRRADEPSTIKVTCLSCKNKWTE